MCLCMFIIKSGTCEVCAVRSVHPYTTYCYSECFYYYQLFNELNMSMNKSLIIYQDNTSTIDMAHKSTKQTRYIDIKYHYIKELLRDNVIKIERVSSDNMLADVMTKALGVSAFIWMLVLL